MSITNKKTVKEIRFYEKSHKYKLSKRTFISVTTLISKYFESFDGKAIARKLAKFKFNKDAKRGVRYWLKEWKGAGEHGTRVHKQLENHILGIKDSDALEQRDLNKIEQGKTWLYEFCRGLNKPRLFPEVVVFSEEDGIAGTIDLLIKVQSDKDPIKDEVILVDWKTNKRIDKKGFKGKKGNHLITEDLESANYTKYSMQLLLYKYIIENNYDLDVTKLIILHLKDDKYVPYEIEIDSYLKEKVLLIVEDNKNDIRKN